MKYFKEIKVWDDEICYKHVINLVRGITNLLKQKNIDKLYFLDIGANVGKVYDLIKDVYDVEKVWMYEASPLLYEYLEDKYKDDDKVVTNHVAISNEEGYINFNEESIKQQIKNGYTYTPNDEFNFGLSKIADSQESIKVRTSKLSSLIDDEILNNVSFIKIDTENFDFYILEDLLTIIDKFSIKPIIEFEVNWNASPLSREDASIILDKFTDLGYEKLTLDDCGGDGILIPLF
jgi:FkbM family methyltransferase